LIRGFAVDHSGSVGCLAAGLNDGCADRVVVDAGPVTTRCPVSSSTSNTGDAGHLGDLVL